MIRFTPDGIQATSRREKSLLHTLDKVYGIKRKISQFGYPGYVYHVAPILKGAGLKVDDSVLSELKRQLSPLKGWDGSRYRWLDTLQNYGDEVAENFDRLSEVPLHLYARADAAEIAVHDQAILAYEPGLGKTRTSIAIAWLWGAERVLIIAPKRLHQQWEQEIERLPISINYTLISYEGLVREESSWDDHDVAIIDEAHNFKNVETERFKAAMRLSAHRRLALTGTPIGGYVRDIYGIVRWVTDKAKYLNPLPPDFRERYGVSDRNRELPGVKFGDSLRNALAPILKIRLRSEPEVQIANQNVRIVRARMEMEPELRRFYLQNARKVREWWLSEDAQTEAKARLGLHRLIRAATIPQSLSGWGDKQTRLQSYIVQKVKGGERDGLNPILMASHIDTAKFYADQLGVPYLSSRMTIARRNKLIQQWKHSGGVLVGTLGVLGEGWNLQESSMIVFAELDWRAWMMVQGIYRILRPGQSRTPTIIIPFYADSVMEYMAKMVANKAEAIVAFSEGYDFVGRMPSHQEMLTKLVLIEKGWVEA